MDLVAYHRGYRERLGRWLLNPFDLHVLGDWMDFIFSTPAMPPAGRGDASRASPVL
jgi:hypothetical protein